MAAVVADPAPQAVPNADAVIALQAALWQAAGEHPDWQVQVEPLQYVESGVAEAAWQGVKSLDTPQAQTKAIRKGGVETLVCRDLVDFRSIVQQTGATFDFRDVFRGRSWARPALARLLVRAQARFDDEFPAARLTVGDIAQPGCGQLAYGTLVRQFGAHDGKNRVTQLLLRARRVLGETLVVEHTTAADYPDERDRFDRADTQVVVEQRIVGAADAGQPGGQAVRVATRRFAAVAPSKKPVRDRREVAKMLAEVAKLVQTGEVVRHDAVVTWDGQAGVERKAWLQHRLDRKRGRQVQLITARPLVGELDLTAVAELRVSKWKPGKPESFSGESRWRRVTDALGEPHWQKWKMLSEAGHLSHLSGRDADVSFVTVDNRGLQAVRLKKLDVSATWRWMEILTATAAELGTPIEHILVGPRVRKWMGKRLGQAAKQSALWRDVLVTAAGHDAHHHIRLVPPSAADDAEALAELQAEPVRTAAGQ